MEKQKKRNVAIEFWRFFFAIAIMGYHIGTIYAPRTLVGIVEASTTMAGAGEILFVFTLTSGYFLVKHFKRLQKEPEYQKESAAKRAWDYLAGRLKALLPVLALGIILGVVSQALFLKASLGTALLSVLNGLWEFLGLYSAGFPAAFSQANGAMWFISSLLLCSYFLYFLLCKNEEQTVGLTVPGLFVFLGGWWYWNGTRASQAGWSTFGVQNATNKAVIGTPVTDAVFGINNGLLFVLTGMCGGILLYYAIEGLRKHKFTEAQKVLLTILYLAVAGLLVVYTIKPELVAGTYMITNNNTGGTLTRSAVHLLCILLVGLTLLGEDAISKLLNNKYTAGLFGYLGGASLYIYMLHCPFIFIYCVVRGMTPAVPYTFGEVYLAVTVISIVLGAVVKYFMDKYVIKR